MILYFIIIIIII